MTFQRADDRAADAPRPFSIETGVLKFAEGSAQIEIGDTRVLVAASIENRVPRFLADSRKGWATAEYAMLPRATHTRSQREVTRGRPSGRSAEIQRLIGRSLRSVLDLAAFPDRTITLDCDVIQADGGTRTAAITAAWVAAAEAFGRLVETRDLSRWPFRDQVAAISVGVVEGVPMLDLEAVEDRSAQVDLNVVATAGGELVEVQGTGEERTFSRDELDRLLDLAQRGIEQLAAEQRRALGGLLERVTERGGERRAAAPKDEKSLWGKP